LSGRIYRSANWLNAWNGTHTWRASASFVTGPQSMKFGYIGGYLEDERKNFTNTVSGLYSITPTAITRAPNNLITSADNYGGQKQMYNGLLVNVSARPRNGLTVQGGMNLGKTVLDICEAREQQPEISGVGGSGITPGVGLTNPYCLSDPGFVTRVTGWPVTRFRRLTCWSAPRSAATRVAPWLRTGQPRRRWLRPRSAGRWPEARRR
jgi:hypothetical protein